MVNAVHEPVTYSGCINCFMVRDSLQSEDLKSLGALFTFFFHSVFLSSIPFFFTSCSLSLNAGVLVSWDIWKHAICGLCGVYLPVDAYKYKISSFIMVKLIFKLPVSSETIDANRCIQNRDAREGIGKSDLE